MNLINFSQGSGDFELDKSTFEYMQEAYKSLNVLGMIVNTENDSSGVGYILSGVYKTTATSGALPDADPSGTYSAGYIYVNGEVFKFEGGAYQSSISKHITNPVLGTAHDSKYSDIVYKFGTTGISSISFDSLKRVPKLMEASFIDEIRMYGGSLGDLPLGWYHCDGSNGTVDMRGRMPIGIDPTYNPSGDTSDYNLETFNASGGSRDHELEVEEMPEHIHGIEDGGDQGGAGGKIMAGSGAIVVTGDLSNASTKPTGGNSKHTNMPPYRVVNFIQYKGYVKP
jgi:microcystin-dependent protein